MTTQNFAKAEMLIRKPVSEVFEAIINPAITSKFWFTKGSGRLDEHNEVQWTWEMYSFTIPVQVKVIEPNSKIVIDWGNYDNTTKVEWNFKPLNNELTFVSIINSGFKGTTEEIINQVRDSTEGFTLVLAGLKAFLEHAIQLNLVADRFPKELNY
ncbi:SRPBCC family protein [Solitalea lacus]|uniref:SRPBCC family protein n=1 Tax=Solitalea lacus TaxID=2911172 RepID=UPI001EDA9E6D|nr:SRPBCC family protein [Solitalea lacus]UKJ08372.1 SRPBCC family protein [Solitalea lacus]